MKGLLTPVPDGHYEVRSFAVDDERQNVAAYAVFRGTHTGEGGPVPPPETRWRPTTSTSWISTTTGSDT
jgi:predicted ester cyclase